MDNRTLEEVRKNEDRLINELEQLQQENQELKKQLENKENKYIPGEYAINEFIKEFDDNILLKNQQKEFIEYLENMLDNENDIFSVVRVKDVLSKYKSIIGGKDE